MTNEISNRTADGGAPAEAVHQAFEELFKKHGFTSERRKHSRNPWSTWVAITPEMGLNAETYTINAVTLDMSLGGLKCLSRDPIASEREVRVRFEELKGRPVFSAIVHSCERMETGGYYKLGIELLALAG